MGQIVRDGLIRGRCFRYRIVFVKKKNKIITFNNWLILQAFKLSAQHGGVEYVQGEVTQVLALQK